MPSAVDLDRFLVELEERRQRILHLVADGNDATLLAEVDELNEQLLVAGEELRVQQEELDNSRLAVGNAGDERDGWVWNAAGAHVLTDRAGLVLYATEPVERLVGRPNLSVTRRPIATWFPLPARPTVRGLIARALASGERQQAHGITLGASPGQQVIVDLAVERTRRATGEGALLRWELIVVDDGRSHHAADGRGQEVVHSGELVAFLGSFCAALDTCRSPDEMYPVIVEAAARLASGGHVGLTVVGAHGVVRPAAWSSDAARRLDTGQLTARSGPLVDAMAGLKPSRGENVAVDDAVSGVALAVPLAVNGRLLGFLTLYVGLGEDIGEEIVIALTALAAHASRALARATEVASLRAGMLTRQLIGEAVGVIMERHRVTAEAAFSQLLQRSQELNIKVRDIASVIVETGQSPSAIDGR